MASSTIEGKTALESMFATESYSFSGTETQETRTKAGYYPICVTSVYSGGGNPGIVVDLWTPSKGQVKYRVLSHNASGAITILWCKCK